jgi:signal recognition particle subunit SRP72
VINLLKAAGSALLESTNPEDKKLANEIFQDLQKRDENDRYAAAGVLATSLDPPSSQSTQFLTPMDRLIAGIDIDQLENAGIPQPPSAPGAEGRKRPAEDTKPKKAKKIRKSRMPKDYDPNETPDPERWLPLRDRSTYRPKGKKGKARANLLSQGAAPTGDSDGSRPNTPGGEVIKQKQQPGGGGKKKKGKGSKW